MEGSLYSCEMPFDPDHASVRHASTAAASIVYTYIWTSKAFLLLNKSGLARFAKFASSFSSSLSSPQWLCEIISHVLWSEDLSTATFALS